MIAWSSLADAERAALLLGHAFHVGAPHDAVDLGIEPHHRDVAERGDVIVPGTRYEVVPDDRLFLPAGAASDETGESTDREGEAHVRPK